MLSVANISVQFGSKKLFNDVSFIVNSSDRIGLVGSNGSGKSTMLKVIAGFIEPDSGGIALSKHTTVDYLPQDGITFLGKTIYDEVYSGLWDIDSVKTEMEEIHDELEAFEDKHSAEYLELVERLGELQHRFDEMDGFKIKSDIEKILMGLGFKADDMDRLTDEFSGGWQMRIALAKLLLKNPTVLLLDEPTNHLDIESLIWLEGFLKSYKGAIVLVSHDRAFLDNITNKTIEIYAGKVNYYSGNYSFYVNEKTARREILEKTYENQQKYLKQQNRFIERFRYKQSKASNVQSRIKLLEKIDLVELEDEESLIHFKFPPATRSGLKVFELDDVRKSYGDNLVFENLDLEIQRNEKIGFLGVNGAGKSTLARIIIGTEEIDKGKRSLGHSVELEYYSQHQADSLDPKNTVLGTLDAVATGDIRKNLRTILGSFLFKGDDVFKSVSVLSGGEKSRLALATMLLKQSNFLVLDEPTNHLDMNSKKVLMRALHDYQGTLLIISHDREFLDGIINKVIEAKNRNVKTYEGNCSYYLMKKAEEQNIAGNGQKTKGRANDNIKKTKEKKRVEAEQRNKSYSRTKNVKSKIKNVEAEIKEKETRIKEIEGMMSLEDFYKDSNRVKKINDEYKIIKDKLQHLYFYWMSETKKLTELETESIKN